MMVVKISWQPFLLKNNKTTEIKTLPPTLIMQKHSLTNKILNQNLQPLILLHIYLLNLKLIKNEEFILFNAFDSIYWSDVSFLR